MVVYIDTSAMLAILHAEDTNHAKAIETWLDLARGEIDLVCNNYVLVEAFSLLQRRYGLEKARVLQERVVPLLEIDWMDQEFHAEAVNSVLTANRRYLSLVDCSSFATMRRLRIETVFTFDEHFKEQGFKAVP
ncbi:MAG: type II toxin-antitoxin system VapC family toxin [Anaerolineales bacterium]